MSNLKKGFTLIEVIVVMIIIAILAGLVYPNYTKLVNKAKQREAENILRAIYTAQDLYILSSQNSEYADSINDLDIQIPADSRYSYLLSLSADRKSFLVEATANLDSDNAVDTWTINQDNDITHTINDIYEE